ncbi:protein kinase domain-containing protein [Hyphococcus sp.]|uniref:protein kinase domain-containing protein n=1 Tax=Hyphococcus sp. TaxID=2038636 RepID=UPI0035C6654F
MSSRKLPTQVKFDRPKKYRVIKELGRGACGETVQLRDEELGLDCVAKKYKPLPEINATPAYEDYFDRFREEARILFRLNHPNIVRVFNFFDYGEKNTAYILMEFIPGENILEYIGKNPENADKIFEGIIDGFAHLEQQRVLHRDIRPLNFLVTNDGVPKIIDFGFGKELAIDSANYDKSISLNWWCAPPTDFNDSIYDHQTEIYFVGKLFEKCIEENSLADFKYIRLVHEMCLDERSKRPSSFLKIQTKILSEQFDEIDFSEQEVLAYREFAESLSDTFSQISNEATYRRDPQELLRRLEDLYKNTMLESTIPGPNRLARIFVDGAFNYWKNHQILVTTLKNFIGVFKASSPEKRNILIGNLYMRLDTVKRTSPPTYELDDDIPF